MSVTERFYADRFDADGKFYVFDGQDAGFEAAGPFDTIEEAQEAAQAKIKALARTPREESIAEFEMAVNVALLAWGDENPNLRRALLDARGNVREALGEART